MSPTLGRTIPVSGYGSAIPVRVEYAHTGSAAAVTTAGLDGSWRVTLPAGGDYRVIEKWSDKQYVVTVPDDGDHDVDELYGDRPTHVSASTATLAAAVVSDRSGGFGAALSRRRERREANT